MGHTFKCHQASRSPNGFVGGCIVRDLFNWTLNTIKIRKCGLSVWTRLQVSVSTWTNPRGRFSYIWQGCLTHFESNTAGSLFKRAKTALSKWKIGSNLSFSDLYLSLTIVRDKKSEEEHIKRGTFKPVLSSSSCDLCPRDCPDVVFLPTLFAGLLMSKCPQHFGCCGSISGRRKTHDDLPSYIFLCSLLVSILASLISSPC
jgi:hypothetical protein